MTTSGYIVLLAAAFVAFFVTLWVFILWLAAWASGWRRLAEHFAATFEFGGEVFSFVSARIGVANYSGALIAGASDQGLYLVPIRIFRPFHRPLLIPWTEIEIDARESAIMPRAVLRFPGVLRKRVFLYGRSAELCMPYVGRYSDSAKPSDQGGREIG